MLTTKLRIGEVVRHTDSPDTQENAAVIVDRDAEGFLTLLAPGVEGVGVEQIDRVSAGDLARTGRRARADVLAEAEEFEAVRDERIWRRATELAPQARRQLTESEGFNGAIRDAVKDAVGSLGPGDVDPLAQNALDEALERVLFQLIQNALNTEGEES